MSLGDKAISYVCTFAAGALLGMSTPTKPETIILRPVVNEYRVAESLGCQEVSNVCRQHKRQERLFHGQRGRLEPTSSRGAGI